MTKSGDDEDKEQSSNDDDDAENSSNDRIEESKLKPDSQFIGEGDNVSAIDNAARLPLEGCSVIDSVARMPQEPQNSSLAVNSDEKACLPFDNSHLTYEGLALKDDSSSSENDDDGNEKEHYMNKHSNHGAGEQRYSSSLSVQQSPIQQ